MKNHNEIVGVVWVIAISVSIRFIAEGLTLKILSATLIFGHIDASVYLAVLAPVLGAHSFIKHRAIKMEGKPNEGN